MGIWHYWCDKDCNWDGNICVLCRKCCSRYDFYNNYDVNDDDNDNDDDDVDDYGDYNCVDYVFYDYDITHDDDMTWYVRIWWIWYL